MTGYVKYTGPESAILNMKVPETMHRYNFPQGKYVHVSDEVDYKYFEFYARANPLDFTAKTRLSKGEVEFGSDRPKPDPKDPAFLVERERARTREDFQRVKDNILRMNSHMLPEEKAALKKMLEDKKEG